MFHVERRGRRPVFRAVRWIVVAGAGVLAIGEAAHWRASLHGPYRLAPQHGERGVVVFGFANAGPRVNAVNRWRGRAAVRAARLLGADSSVGRGDRSSVVTMVCTGGAVRGTTPEALLLAQYIHRRQGWSGQIITETDSRSTWENVRNVLPILEDADWIAFVSGSLHAEKARIHLQRMRPDLAARLVNAREYRAGELIAFKPMFAAIGLWKLHTLRH
ncbi:ElyC/SanA/YdcF family protein [Curtobacterium sp. ISL-83]|uniref:ElyC/SanA/YdcF family protein n=1 Tax=Curtobacterium sp. ISL-83 TaxID=2819145 RepID=UPI0020352198|nr:ElyC/SanA/YdcF family protein [Curtobacterium sp. ISL-83]